MNKREAYEKFLRDNDLNWWDLGYEDWLASMESGRVKIKVRRLRKSICYGCIAFGFLAPVLLCFTQAYPSRVFDILVIIADVMCVYLITKYPRKELY